MNNSENSLTNQGFEMLVLAKYDKIAELLEKTARVYSDTCADFIKIKKEVLLKDGNIRREAIKAIAVLVNRLIDSNLLVAFNDRIGELIGDYDDESIMHYCTTMAKGYAKTYKTEGNND